MVASGELSAPVVIGRDHLDSGSVASPNRETEQMKDGSDAVSDWPLLNALLNTASGATWVSFIMAAASVLASPNMPVSLSWPMDQNLQTRSWLEFSGMTLPQASCVTLMRAMRRRSIAPGLMGLTCPV